MNKNPINFKIIEDATKDVLYTYKAKLKEVVDGDTIWVNIYTGLDILTIQKIRLRGINASSTKLEAGRKARDFVVRQLSQCEYFIVKTIWRDNSEDI